MAQPYAPTELLQVPLLAGVGLSCRLAVRDPAPKPQIRELVDASSRGQRHRCVVLRLCGCGGRSFPPALVVPAELLQVPLLAGVGTTEKLTGIQRGEEHPPSMCTPYLSFFLLFGSPYSDLRVDFTSVLCLLTKIFLQKILVVHVCTHVLHCSVRLYHQGMPLA